MSVYLISIVVNNLKIIPIRLTVHVLEQAGKVNTNLTFLVNLMLRGETYGLLTVITKPEVDFVWLMQKRKYLQVHLRYLCLNYKIIDA